MSVSLTHVQAALQNHLTTGGSGPLTLNVLHKTDNLVQQLQSLNQGKPLSIEVIKSLPNGRAEVITNGLKLDVKASLPLQTGEVLQLKLEQHGSALRFVQPLGEGGASAKSSLSANQPLAQQASLSQTGRGLVQTGVSQVNGAQNAAALNTPPVTTTHLSTTPQVNTVGQVNSVGQANTVAQANLQTGHTAALQNSSLSPSSGSLQQGALTPAQGGQALNAQQASTLVNSGGTFNSNTQGVTGAQGVRGAEVNTHVQNPTQTQAQTQAQALVASQTAKPSQAQAQITASSLIGVVADTLPGIAKKLAGRSNSLTQVRAHDKYAGRGGAHGPLAFKAAGGLQTQQSAEDVSAKYQSTSSLAIEEVQEIQQKPFSKAMEFHLELPLHGAEKPVFIHLHINPEQESNDQGEERDGFGVKFSLETEDTGPVHAAVGLFGQNVRITLWAERAEFAESLNLYRDTLNDRLAATGLDVGSLHIRRGRPSNTKALLQDHVDAKV